MPSFISLNELFIVFKAASSLLLRHPQKPDASRRVGTIVERAGLEGKKKQPPPPSSSAVFIPTKSSVSVSAEKRKQYHIQTCFNCTGLTHKSHWCTHAALIHTRTQDNSSQFIYTHPMTRTHAVCQKEFALASVLCVHTCVNNCNSCKHSYL